MKRDDAVFELDIVSDVAQVVLAPLRTEVVELPRIEHDEHVHVPFVWLRYGFAHAIRYVSRSELSVPARVADERVSRNARRVIRDVPSPPRRARHTDR
ncbi:hypothetical protein BRD01_01780 [Halobacteriales archaeon QS_8_65_32]|nr:MAG: hypothetical protein BRD01_01780 [Halobacteriales archaeon QS_8_65_32]